MLQLCTIVTIQLNAECSDVGIEPEIWSIWFEPFAERKGCRPQTKLFQMRFYMVFICNHQVHLEIYLHFRTFYPSNHVLNKPLATTSLAILFLCVFELWLGATSSSGSCLKIRLACVSLLVLFQWAANKVVPQAECWDEKLKPCDAEFSPKAEMLGQWAIHFWTALS